MPESQDMRECARLQAEDGVSLAECCRKYTRKLLKTKTLFALALASLLFSSIAQRYLGRSMTPPNADFYVYFFAAQMVHDNPHAELYAGTTGQNPQTRSAPRDSEIQARAKAAGFDDINLYLYPPLLADLFAPISRIPAPMAAALWRAVNLALVLVSVLLLTRLLRVPVLGFEFATLAVAAYLFFPVHEAIWVGQVTIAMLALWTIGIVAYFDGLVVLSAAAFALATALKVTPVLLLPLFIIWKDRRWVLSYLAVSLGLLSTMIAINGWQTVSVYPSVMSAMGDGIPYVWNKTIGSVVTWVYYGRVYSSGANAGVMDRLPHTLPIIAKALSGAFYLYCLYLVWRNRKQLDRAMQAATIAVFALVTCCASPVSWRHSFAAVFIALAICWAKALRIPARLPHTILLALTTFSLSCIVFDLAAEAPLPQFCKVFMAASTVVIYVLFCLDTLSHMQSAGHAGEISAS